MTGFVGLLVSWGINVLALLIADGLLDGVEIRRWGPLVLGGAVLGVANAVLRPVLALLTLPLVVVTLGAGLIGIGVLMLALTEWITPDFSIDGFWSYVGATVIVSLSNAVLGPLLGRRRRPRPAVRVTRSR
jgi:putative membrane protein